MKVERDAMQRHTQQGVAVVLAVLLLLSQALPAAAKRTEVKPGWNLFSVQQDIELGREASAEAEKQLPLLRDARVDSYLNRLGKKLAAEAPGHKYPYQFKAINDGSINAFALPGGFLYVNRGTIEAAENEAQLAGVVAHEIGHVALRHGTNQLSKAVALRAPLAIAGGLLGGSGSLLGQLAQLGLEVGFTAVFLKYSRTAETQADVLATQLLFDTGYEPREYGRFFAKIEKAGGGGGVQFFSDHPNPKNRVKRVDEEIAQLGSKPGLRKDSEEFHAIRSLLQAMPVAPKRGEKSQPGSREVQRPEPPSSRFRDYQGRLFSLSFPENWRVIEEGNGGVIAPDGGVVALEGGGNAIAYGVIANALELEDPNESLEEATDRLLEVIRQSNPGTRETSRRRTRLASQRALSVQLTGESPRRGEHETNWLLTLLSRDHLFYLVCIAPEKEFRDYKPTFDRILSSFRLR